MAHDDDGERRRWRRHGGRWTPIRARDIHRRVIESRINHTPHYHHHHHVCIHDVRHGVGAAVVVRVLDAHNARAENCVSRIRGGDAGGVVRARVRAAPNARARGARDRGWW